MLDGKFKLVCVLIGVLDAVTVQVGLEQSHFVPAESGRVPLTSAIRGRRLVCGYSLDQGIKKDIEKTQNTLHT